MTYIDAMAASIPNLTSDETPQGNEPKVVGYINKHPESDPSSSDRVWRSHVHIGSELNLLDFSGAATTSGWGWYFLLNEATKLERALIEYAISVAEKRGWGTVTPPSMVYSHIAAACGFNVTVDHTVTLQLPVGSSQEIRMASSRCIVSSRMPPM